MILMTKMIHKDFIVTSKSIFHIIVSYFMANNIHKKIQLN